MASTLTYSDAWTVARQQYRVGDDNTVMEYATNVAIAEMWMLYDWRGTVKSLPPFWVVPGETDYGKPFYAIPTDFFGLRECYLIEAASNNQFRSVLQVQENLEETGYIDFPKKICYRSSISGFRIWPCPDFGISCPYYLVNGTYKARPPKIVRATLNTTIYWDDMYFNALVQAIAWAALVFSGQRDEASKQYMIFRQALETISSTENLELGEPSIHPYESLTIFGRPTWWGGLP